MNEEEKFKIKEKEKEKKDDKICENSNCKDLSNEKNDKKKEGNKNEENEKKNEENGEENLTEKIENEEKNVNKVKENKEDEKKNKEVEKFVEKELKIIVSSDDVTLPDEVVYSNQELQRKRTSSQSSIKKPHHFSLDNVRAFNKNNEKYENNEYETDGTDSDGTDSDGTTTSGTEDYIDEEEEEEEENKDSPPLNDEEIFLNESTMKKFSEIPKTHLRINTSNDSDTFRKNLQDVSSTTYFDKSGDDGELVLKGVKNIEYEGDYTDDEQKKENKKVKMLKNEITVHLNQNGIKREFTSEFNIKQRKSKQKKNNEEKRGPIIVDENTKTATKKKKNIFVLILRFCMEKFPPLASVPILSLFKDPKTNYGMGPVLGVMVPILLNIFGVSFLRIGMIVGQVGILGSIGMFSIGYFATFLTVLSLSAISTNGRIKSGGVYFMISRVLGPEFGGSIGIIFYSATLTGCVLYVMGFTETIIQVFPQIIFASDYFYWIKLLYCTIVLAIIGTICFIGSSLFSVVSIVIFLTLLISLSFSVFSFVFNQWIYNIPQLGYVGWSWSNFQKNLLPKYFQDPDTNQMHNAFSIFGILFPMCTGIFAGANMSGNLKKPSVSIPTGTIISNVSTYIIYCSLCLLMGITTDREKLALNYLIMADISYLRYAILPGIFALAFFAGLVSITGGSQILQALARDQLFPFLKLAGKGFGSNDEPRIAVICTWFLCQCLLFTGNLNAISPFVTMFFLLSYCFMNASCFSLTISHAPNFRPTFKLFSWITCGLGSLSCLAIMFVIDYISASITIMCLILIILFEFAYTKPKPWGDISKSIIYFFVKKLLYKTLLVEQAAENLKYWRFKVLLFQGSPIASQDYNIINFISSITEKRGGFLITGNVKISDLTSESIEYSEKLRAKFSTIYKALNIEAYPQIIITPNYRLGAQILLTQSGIGELKPNTVVLPFFETPIFKHSENDVPHLISCSSKSSMSYLNFNTINRKEKKKKKLMKKQLLEELGKIRISGISAQEYVLIIKDCLLLKKNLIIFRNFHMIDKKKMAFSSFLHRLAVNTPLPYIDNIADREKKFIDIYLLNMCHWKDENIEPNTALTLTLGYLIIESNTKLSRSHKIRVIRIVNCKSQIKKEKKRILNLLNKARIGIGFGKHKFIIKIVPLIRDDFNIESLQRRKRKYIYKNITNEDTLTDMNNSGNFSRESSMTDFDQNDSFDSSVSNQMIKFEPESQDSTSASLNGNKQLLSVSDPTNINQLNISNIKTPDFKDSQYSSHKEINKLYFQLSQKKGSVKDLHKFGSSQQILGKKTLNFFDDIDIKHKVEYFYKQKTPLFHKSSSDSEMVISPHTPRLSKHFFQPTPHFIDDTDYSESSKVHIPKSPFYSQTKKVIYPNTPLFVELPKKKRISNTLSPRIRHSQSDVSISPTSEKIERFERKEKEHLEKNKKHKNKENEKNIHNEENKIDDKSEKKDEKDDKKNEEQKDNDKIKNKKIHHHHRSKHKKKTVNNEKKNSKNNEEEDEENEEDKQKDKLFYSEKNITLTEFEEFRITNRVMRRTSTKEKTNMLIVTAPPLPKSFDPLSATYYLGLLNEMTNNFQFPSLVIQGFENVVATNL